MHIGTPRRILINQSNLFFRGVRIEGFSRNAIPRPIPAKPSSTSMG
jgi:hypothetical protein